MIRHGEADHQMGLQKPYQYRLLDADILLPAPVTRAQVEFDGHHTLTLFELGAVETILGYAGNP